MKTFAQEAKKIMASYKGYENDPLAKEAMNKKLQELAVKQEAYKEAVNKDTSDRLSDVDYNAMAYGGCIKKGLGGKIDILPEYKRTFAKGAKEYGMDEKSFAKYISGEMSHFESAGRDRMNYTKNKTSKYANGGKMKKYDEGGWTEDALKRHWQNQGIDSPYGGTFYPETGSKLTAEGTTDFTTEPLPSFTNFLKDTDSDTYIKSKEVPTSKRESSQSNYKNLKKEANKDFFSDPGNYLGLATLAGPLASLAANAKGPYDLNLDKLSLERANYGEAKALATASANQALNRGMDNIKYNATSAGQLLGNTVGAVGKAAEASGRNRAAIEMEERNENLRRSDVERTTNMTTRHKEEQYRTGMEEEYRMRDINAIAGIGQILAGFGQDRSKAVTQYIDQMTTDESLAQSLPFYQKLFELMQEDEQNKKNKEQNK